MTPAARHDAPPAADLAPLAARFEAARPALRAVAYRLLGSASEAEDAVQEGWLRLARADVRAVENLEGWLTTVVARVCLDALRARTARHEAPLGTPLGTGVRRASGATADDRAARTDLAHEAELADAVGLALLVVLERLAPAERVAFVLHDAFDLPFEAIAQVLGRTPAATRQLASRARRRVRGERAPDGDAPRTHRASPDERARQRAVVDAYLAASRAGDFAALVAVLDPDVVLRADAVLLPAGAPATARGARDVAGRALAYGGRAGFARVALVDGAVGLVVAPRGRLLVVLALTVRGDRITAIDVVAEPERLARLELAVLD